MQLIRNGSKRSLPYLILFRIGRIHNRPSCRDTTESVSSVLYDFPTFVIHRVGFDMTQAIVRLLYNRTALIVAPALIFILWLLIADSTTSWWDYDPIVDSRVLVGIIALVLVAITIIAPTFRPISVTQKTILSALRLGVVALLVVFMLRPTCVSIENTKQTAVLLMLIDQSRSMTLPHSSDKETRWQAQSETLKENEAAFRDLAKDLEIKVYSYDSQLHPLEFKDGALKLPSAANGDSTDVGTPLYNAILDQRSSRLAGVIFMGDGVQTVSGDSPRVEPWEVSDELVRLDQPLYTIAYGPSGNVEDARDLAVINLPDSYSAFVKNELLVNGTVQLRGFQNVEVPVEMIIEDASGKEEVVDTVRVTATKANEQRDVSLSFTPQATGQYRLTLRAVPQQGETVVKNNELSAFLTVYGGGLRVLYLEGELRSEQKFLRRSLDASNDIELDFQWIDHRLRDRWPVELTRLFKDPQYDVFIIGDVDSRALYQAGKNEENLKALVEAVEKGKGLLMMGGFHSFGPGRYGLTPLADVLPIEIGKFEGQDFKTPIRDDLHIQRKLQMLPTSSHFLTRLAAEDENLRTWRDLPALDGANKFQDIKERSVILAESDDGVPLLVSAEYGGRVLAFAGDSTWQWWMQGHDDKHRRFWRQAILWLAKRDDLSEDDVWIKLRQRRYDPGSQVEFTAGAKTGAGDVIRDAIFDASVILPDGSRKPISLTRTADEQAGRLDDTKLPGTYTVEVTASQNAKELGTAKAKFMVYDHDVELTIPEANHDLLARMANQTKGRPVAPEELGDLLREIKNQPLQLNIEIPKKWQLGDTWQDAWLFFLGFVSLLTTEWVLRKKWGLV